MAIAYLRPTTTELADAGTSAVGAATRHEACDDAYGAADGNASYVNFNSSGSVQRVRYGFEDLGEVASIESVTILWGAIDDNGGGGHVTHTPRLRSGGTNYDGTARVLTTVDPPYPTYEDPWTKDPNTNQPFTRSAVNALQAEFEQAFHATAQGRHTQVLLRVSYTPVPDGPHREIATSRLRRRRRPPEELEVALPLWALDNDLMEDVSATYFSGPQAQGEGWGLLEWERRLLQNVELTEDPMTMTVLARMRSRHGFLCTFYDGCRSFRSSSALEDGVPRLTTGGALTHLRASPAWIEDPSSGLVVAIGNDAKAVAAGGMLVEKAASNVLAYSSAADGSTSGWTASGPTTLSAEASPPEALFHSSVSNHCYKLTAGSPHSSDGVVTASDTITVAANTVGRCSFDHKDDSGATLYWRLQRLVDSWYWNDSSGAWQSGLVNNALTVRTTRTRDLSEAINVGGSNTALRFAYVQLSGGTNGRVNRVYHSQIEDSPFATSRIVTRGSAVTRALATYTYAHSAAKPGLRNAGFSHLMQMVPLWATADLTTDIYLWRLAFDATNWWELRYTTAGNLEFRCSVGGAVATASKAHTFARGQTYKIAVRATTVAGELGLAARTLSVCVDGAKGTDATRVGDPTEASANLRLGGDGTLAVNGQMWPLLFTQEILSDNALARFEP